MFRKAKNVIRGRNANGSISSEEYGEYLGFWVFEIFGIIGIIEVVWVLGFHPAPKKKYGDSDNEQTIEESRTK